MYVIHIQLRIYWYTSLCPWFLLLSESLISTACLIIHHHSIIILSSILLHLPCDFGRFWASLASQLVGQIQHPSLGHRSPNIIPLPLILPRGIKARSAKVCNWCCRTNSTARCAKSKVWLCWETSVPAQDISTCRLVNRHLRPLVIHALWCWWAEILQQLISSLHKIFFLQASY